MAAPPNPPSPIDALAKLTAAQVQALTIKQINGLATAYFQALNLSLMTNAQLAGLSAFRVAEITPAQSAKLSAAQVAILPTAGPEVSKMTAAQLNALTATQLAGLTAAQVATLSAAQLSGLTTANFRLLNLSAVSVSTFNSLSSPTLSTITAAQAGSLSATTLNGLSLASFRSLSLTGLTTAQIGGLAAATMAEITLAQFSALSTAQVAAFSGAQLSGLSSTVLAGLSVAQERALTASQISGMSAMAFGSLNLSVLTAAQVASLTAAQVASLSVANFDKLLPVLASINASAFAGVSLADLQSMRPAQLNAMSTAQKSALTGEAAAYCRVFTELSGFMGDGKLSFGESEKLLKDFAKGGMTSGEFAALQAVATSLNVAGGYATTAMIDQLFDNVVLGNAGNAIWTGGSSTHTKLGNLAANSTELQACELIAKWFDGADNPTCSEFYSSTYKAQTGPLWNGAPTYSQVNQGAVGDCYFEAAMISIATESPSFLKNMVTANENGTFTVAFWDEVTKSRDYVTVDNQLAVMQPGAFWRNYSTLAFSNGGASGSIWSGIIEKAYVEWRSAHDATPNDYLSITGGWGEGITAITGQSVNEYFVSGSKTASQLAAVLGTCQSALAAHNAVMVGNWTDNPALGLVAGHMYSVLGVNASAGTVTIDNPWNANGFYNAADAVRTVKIGDLAANMADFFVAQG